MRGRKDEQEGMAKTEENENCKGRNLRGGNKGARQEFLQERRKPESAKEREQKGRKENERPPPENSESLNL